MVIKTNIDILLSLFFDAVYLFLIRIITALKCMGENKKRKGFVTSERIRKNR